MRRLSIVGRPSSSSSPSSPPSSSVVAATIVETSGARPLQGPEESSSTARGVNECVSEPLQEVKC
eukprot:15441401-Alexandrium_andersonii.AAC.1